MYILKYMKRLRRQRGLQNDGYALPLFFEKEKWKMDDAGWWDLVWSTYDEHHFKETFRVTRATFMYILQNIRPALEKQMRVEEPISPESRLAVCLYRLGRGDYLYAISELTAAGK